MLWEVATLVRPEVRIAATTRTLKFQILHYQRNAALPLGGLQILLCNGRRQRRERETLGPGSYRASHRLLWRRLLFVRVLKP